MENGIVIRKAEKEDVRQIAEICVEDWKEAYRGIIESDYLDSLSVDQRYEIEVKRYEKFIVAADGKKVLGYAWLELADDDMADCEVIALYVRYSYRKNGIGKLLLQYAIRHFQDLGKKKMIIWCLKENSESRIFYEKTGGKESQTGSHNWGGKDYDMISYLYDLED
ncbi:MAG: GNAT family N-acetyltransferase [Clostridiales bacterium]|nr:GNAT family N-acetyltransferase [Clostridiales bacterium]